jgi:hypothetical protein
MQRQFNSRVHALTIIKIAEMASATQRVETHVTENVEPRVQRTESVTAETYQTTKDIQERGRRLDIQMRTVSDNVETQGDILMNIHEMLRDLLSNNECESCWLMHAKRGHEAETYIGQREAEERKSQTTRLQLENYHLGLEHVRSLTPSEAPSESAKKWFLWKIIDVDPERCIEEAGSMLRSGQGMSRAPTQVLKMYKNARVQKFLTSATSDAVFVEALLEREEMSRCSSMSLACAVLLQDLGSSGYSHAAAIHYFCGAHNNLQDSLSGGIGIARVLIGQLLCLQDFDFSFLHAEWRAALEAGDPLALFSIFEQLVFQLNIPTLFCVIDAVTLFEGNLRKDDTDAMVSEILRVAVECRHRVHLKLLVTSSGKSRVIAPRFQRMGGFLRLEDGGEAEVSMRAVKLEIARHSRVRLSPSPGRTSIFSAP